MRKLCLFIACSLDGYIAKHNHDLSFLQLVEKEGEDYGYADFIQDIDTIIIGRKTYDFVKNNIGVSHYDNGTRDVYVITHTPQPAQGRIQFYNGDLRGLIQVIMSKEGKNIYCDGGSEVINTLLRENLIHEMTISIIPILLGNGIKLFQNHIPEQELQLISSKSYDSGLVQLRYTRKVK